MTWSTLFGNFIQPALFAGLFAMTFVSMLVVLRNERREKMKRKRRIVFHQSAIDPFHSHPERRAGGIGQPHGRKPEDSFTVLG